MPSAALLPEAEQLLDRVLFNIQALGGEAWKLLYWVCIIIGIMENQMENQMEHEMENQMENDMETGIIEIMENQMEKNMENEMETGLFWVIL